MNEGLLNGLHIVDNEWPALNELNKNSGSNKRVCLYDSYILK